MTRVAPGRSLDLQVYGYIDPGHVVDREGNRYLFFSGGVLVPLAPDGLSVTGELKKVYEGWQYPAHWVVEGHCLEAPKPTFYNGWYYLSSAQGGTAGPSTAHMGVIARAKSPEGPWRTRPTIHVHLQREEKWWRQGHGTYDDVEGNWWFLYTGYEQGYEEFSSRACCCRSRDRRWLPRACGASMSRRHPDAGGRERGARHALL